MSGAEQADPRIARLRVAICDCSNKEGRHACDAAAEEVADALRSIEANETLSGRGRWRRVTAAIHKELKANA